MFNKFIDGFRNFAFSNIILITNNAYFLKENYFSKNYLIKSQLYLIYFEFLLANLSNCLFHKYFKIFSLNFKYFYYFFPF